MNKVSLNSFTTISVIGEGTYSKIILVKKKDNSKYFAMKTLKKSLLKEKKKENYIKNEINTIDLITDNNFLIKHFWTFQTKNKFHFILEYCPGGDLFNLLEKKRKLTIAQTKFYTAQIILALEHLHNKKLIYRSLKPENILINKDGYIKLTNFSISRKVEDDEAKTICGNIDYLAPEILIKKGYGKEIDFWSLGCIVYEMLFGISPFYCDNNYQMIQKILKFKPNFLEGFDPVCTDFLKGLLKKKKEMRLGFNGIDELKNHKFFENLNWQKIKDKKIKPFFLPNFKGDLGLNNFDGKFTQVDPNSYSIISRCSDRTDSDSDCGRTYEDFSWTNKNTNSN